MIYGGDGLARLPADGGRAKVAFVPFVLPGEEVAVASGRSRSDFVRASLVKVESASPHRVEPNCPHFRRCGGCSYQHADYPYQLELKAAILRESLLRTARLEWKEEITVRSAAPWHYRNRSRFHVRTGSDFAIGYHRLGSRELVPVEACPISSPLLNQALGDLWTIVCSGGFPPFIREIELFADADDRRLLVELLLSASPAKEETKRLDEFATSLRSAASFVIGFAAFSADVAPEGSSRPAWQSGESELSYRAAGRDFRVSAGSFFQTNRYLLDELVETATGGIQGNVAWDLYAGVGLFSLALAKSFAQVVAVESTPSAARDLKHNLPENAKAVRATTEEFLSRAKDHPIPDFVLLDPPRAGLGADGVRSLAAIAPPRLTYVSCDPATLARDLRGLLDGGYRIASLHLVDMFPQTYHLETVVHLQK